MKYVEIYQLKDDGKQHVILTCTLSEGGNVKLSGDEGLMNRLKQEGILDYTKTDFSRLYPDKGGLKFLKQLAHNFRSGYLMASDIKDES